jgi:pyruvate kinase
VLGDENIVSTTYKELPATVKSGDVILVDDGLIGMTVDSVTEKEVHCTIQNDGTLGQVKGVNLPGVTVTLPAVTDKDKADIAFGLKNDIDFIAASFIRKASDVEEIRNLPGVREQKVLIISKIESQEGLDNFDEILNVSDGIMVARGDLGVEIPIEMVANAQKLMIRKCNFAGKPVITATQMLESMIQYPRPTRAEATDVINAVYDGSDCIMLSGETAKGKFPTEAVAMMSKLARQAEINLDYRSMFRLIRNYSITTQAQEKTVSVPESVASSAVKSAWDLNAPVLICLSDSGNTLRFVSKYRPHSTILCITSCPRTARQVLLSRSAIPLLVKSMNATDSLIAYGIEYAKEHKLAKAGDFIVTTSGYLEGVSGGTNIMRVTLVT